MNKTHQEAAETIYGPNTHCPICNFEKNMDDVVSHDTTLFTCAKCGNYKMSYELAADAHDKSQYKLISENKHLLQGFIHKSNSENTNPQFDKVQDLETVINNYFFLNTLKSKVDFTLHLVSRKSTNFGDWIHVSRDDYSKFFCKSSSELICILETLRDKGLIKIELSTSIYNIQVTLDGVTYAEDRKIDSDQCFVAMWFNDSETKDLAILLEKVITELGFKYVRIDKLHHSNDITDEIIFQIKRSKFLIADLTGDRSGVYFEAGFAKGIGLPVILTCRNSDFKEGKVHFDLNHRPILFWDKDNMNDFEQSLINKIGAEVL